ncbi:transposase family protein [Streptomyces sp. NPDC007095]|uniref:transposase family protein n=1 Tax=Streptomyces sp. NPDC007095 TaxID=3154482 RepID=UPI0033DF5E3E
MSTIKGKVQSDRLAGVRDNGNDLWFSQKHKAFGGNIQFLSGPDGTPLWVSDVEPGSTPDITAARIHALPALYKAAADGLPTLADKGYIGAGIGIRIPVRRPKGKSEQALHADTRMLNMLLRHVRPSASAPPPSSSSDGGLCSTSRSARAGSATSPAPPSSSTQSGSDHR